MVDLRATWAAGLSVAGLDAEKFASLQGAVGDHGPATSVSYLCFFGGVLNVLYNFFFIIDGFDALYEPITYVVCAYQLVFGLIACMIEAPEEWLKGVQTQSVATIQQRIHENALFLTTKGGRGLFYAFQGSLLLALDSVYLSSALGLYMLLLGVVLIAMQCGFLSTTGEAEVRGDYIHVHG
mmetsp:Transcript_79539/g.225478  ORF Transcript_79539/g.225478 Transcript_79539/m.225478 type:complete len:181 (+) Transcript_79539:32-574(+)